MKTLKQLLLELFDKPWNKTYDHDATLAVKQHLNSHELYKNKSFVNVQAHRLESDNGHLVSYIHNGMLEIHHLDIDGKSGEITNKTKINPRFISTFFQHAQECALSKHKPVRLTMTDAIHSQTRGIVERLAKNHNCNITHNIENVGGTMLHHLEVRNNPNESFIGSSKILSKDN